MLKKLFKKWHDFVSYKSVPDLVIWFGRWELLCNRCGKRLAYTESKYPEGITAEAEFFTSTKHSVKKKLENGDMVECKCGGVALGATKINGKNI